MRHMHLKSVGALFLLSHTGKNALPVIWFASLKQATALFKLSH